MAERSFAGYTYHQRIAVGFYGEVYRAFGAERDEVRILHVDPDLVRLDVFADALATIGPQLAGLQHKHVEATRAVGTTPEGDVVVIADPTAGPVTLARVLGDVEDGPPLAIAIAIGRAVLEGLARAHAMGVVHGCVHPRSVIIGAQGSIKIADFAAARALAVAATRADDLSLLKAKGYMAPELALGDAANEAADVYSAGVMLQELLGASPPIPLATVLSRALATDPSDRFSDAQRLAAAFEGVLAQVDAAPASQRELARFVADMRGAAEASLDAETDDFVSGLSDGTGLDRALGELAGDDDGDGDDGGPTEVRAADADVDADEPTAVDHPVAATMDDPVSELIRAASPAGASLAQQLAAGSDFDDDETYLPPPMTQSSHDLSREAERASAAFRAAERLAELRHEHGTEPVARVRTGGGLWILTALVAVAGMAAVLYTQTDLFHPERRAAREAALEAEHQRLVEEAEASAVRAGDVIIDSDPGEAAVWMSLGRTPVETPALSAGVVHQLRVEHDGYAPADIDVTGVQWTGAGGQMRAAVKAELTPAAPGTRVAAAPPAPASPTTDLAGRGVIRVESEPPGAHAFVLVGFTPEVTLRGVRAGDAYEFKVAKDGYAPAFIVIRPDEWRGPDGQLVRQVSREASLAPVPKK